MSTTDFSGIEAQLEAANDAAKLAASHASEWKSNKAIKAGSTLAEELDTHLTNVLERLAEEKANEASRIGKQLERMRIEDEQRRLQEQIEDNAAKLKALQ